MGEHRSQIVPPSGQRDDEAECLWIMTVHSLDYNVSAERPTTYPLCALTKDISKEERANKWRKAFHYLGVDKKEPELTQ